MFLFILSTSVIVPKPPSHFCHSDRQSTAIWDGLLIGVAQMVLSVVAAKCTGFTWSMSRSFTSQITSSVGLYPETNCPRNGTFCNEGNVLCSIALKIRPPTHAFVFHRSLAIFLMTSFMWVTSRSPYAPGIVVSNSLTKASICCGGTVRIKWITRHSRSVSEGWRPHACIPSYRLIMVFTGVR